MNFLTRYLADLELFGKKRQKLITKKNSTIRFKFKNYQLNSLKILVVYCETKVETQFLKKHIQKKKKKKEKESTLRLTHD